MALKKFATINMNDREISKFQDNVDSYLNQLNPLILSGLILKDILIGTSTTLVEHKLGASFNGWQMVDIQADARVWRDSTSSADSKRFLPLKASAPVTVSLWVY